MNNNFLLTTKWTSWVLVVALGLSVGACSSPEQRAQAHYVSGKQLLQAGEFAKAGLEFRNALKLNEKMPDAWFGLASVDEHRQNWAAVLEDLQKVIEMDPKNFDALIKLAKLQLAAVQMDKALKNVNLANDLKKNDTDVLALRAAILFRLNDREGARANAEQALAINPDNPDAHAVLAADQMADGHSAVALQFIERGLLKDPKNLGLLMFKLKVFEDGKDDPKLEATLRQVIAAYPEIKEMKQALLGFLISRNRVADVETEMRAAAAADPNDSGKALDLVSLIGATKGTVASHKELETLIAAKPDIAAYKLSLAQLDFSEKRTDVAIAAVESVIAKSKVKEDVLRAQLLLADMNIRLGRTDAAKELVAKILAEDAKNAEALALRASIRLKANDVDNAVADLREALNQEPNSVPFLMLLGRAHERQGAVGLANDRFAEALKVSKYDPQVVLDYIDFLERRGKNDQTETILTDAVAKNPRNNHLLKALAQIKLNKQDWAGAQLIAETLKKIGDDSGVGTQIVGAVQLGQKKYDESIATLKGAYSSSDQTPQPMYSLFLAYMQAGKTSEAEDFIQSILKVNDKNAEARVLLGSIRMTQNKPVEAEAAFKQAIEGQPANPMGYTSLSKLYMSQKKNAEAETILKTGHEKLPEDMDISLLLAGLLEVKSDFDGAVAIYEAQLKSKPDAVIMINNLASILADYRTDPESLERARQLSQRLEAIDLPQFKDTLGWVAYRTGDYRTALTNLEQAVEKLPNYALVRYHLAMTYIALKRNNDAKDQLQKADALLKDGDPLKEKIRAATTGMSAAN